MHGSHEPIKFMDKTTQTAVLAALPRTEYPDDAQTCGRYECMLLLPEDMKTVINTHDRYCDPNPLQATRIHLCSAQLAGVDSLPPYTTVQSWL